MKGLLPLLLIPLSFAQADLAAILDFPGSESALRGLVLHLGSTDGRLEAELAARSPGILIQGLCTDADACEKTRAYIREHGGYGRASVRRASSLDRLDLADDLVSLLIVTTGRPPAPEEISRVLAPNGIARIKAKGGWTTYREPMPADVDEWHHWDHRADGNPSSRDRRVGPTTSLRWLAGSTKADRTGAKVGLRIADGRVYYTGVDYEPEGRFRRKIRSDVFARDAFTGILLWKRALDGVAGGGDDPPRFALAARDGRVYCYPENGGKLHALDARTGETRIVFEDGPDAPKLKDWDKWNDPISKVWYIVRILGDDVIQTRRGEVFVSDAKTGSLKWKKSLGDQAVVGWAVAAEGRLFATVADQALIKNRSAHITPASRVVALDLADGTERWTYTGLADYALFRMIHYRDSIILPAFSMQGYKPNFNRDPVVVRLNAASGRETWKVKPEKAGSRGHYPTLMARGDEIIIGQQAGFGLDFATGEITRHYNWGQVDNSCADLKCVPGYTMYGQTFIDQAGKRIHRGQTRSICDVGLFPAYGMLYGSPLGCLCSEYVNGYTALSSEPLAPAVPDADRLSRGPAFGKLSKPDLQGRPGDWPLHLGNARRGASTKTALPDTLKLNWERPLATPSTGPLAEDWRDNEKITGLLSAPTAAAGKVFVASPDAHRLSAVDAQTGAMAWSFNAEARIDSPPTLLHADGDALCVFGSRDGYVYALRASDGALAWKFLAARANKRICVSSQLESSWPVTGSVLTDGDGLVVTAGRQSAIDGGIKVYKLSPADGRILWHTRLWSDPDSWQSLDDPSLVRARTRNQRVNDLLVHNGKQACLWITPLKNHYAENERVDIEHAVYATRAMKFSVPSKDELRELEGATWLFSGSSAGLLSRRMDSVGRHDASGVQYAALNARKICLDGNTLYALEGGAGKSKALRGGLMRVSLQADGRLPETPDWTGKGPGGEGAKDAMIVAGERIYIAAARNPEEPALHVYSTRDGSLIGTLPLPARVVRDGLAAANGRLYLAGVDGVLRCLGE